MASRPYVTRLSRQAYETLVGMGEADYERVDAFLSLFETQPHMGHPFSPDYEVALPPVDLNYLHVPSTHWFLLYQVDDEAGAIKLMLLGDSRRDPRTQFAHVPPEDWSVSS